MDGNGRWAEMHNRPRSEGHLAGVQTLYNLVEATAKLGIKVMTVYAFSTENWQRPTSEVDNLMALFGDSLARYTPELKARGIRLLAIGDLAKLPHESHHELMRAMDETSCNDTLTLVVALSYSSRVEINKAFCQGVRAFAESKHSNPPEVLDPYKYPIERFLDTYQLPDPDLLIRTGGEIRLSNFLLYQMAYTELYFSEKLWPDFDEKELYKALEEYARRERRFGILDGSTNNVFSTPL